MAIKYHLKFLWYISHIYYKKEIKIGILYSPPTDNLLWKLFVSFVHIFLITQLNRGNDLVFNVSLSFKLSLLYYIDTYYFS